jgi:hypothetical protein
VSETGQTMAKDQPKIVTSAPQVTIAFPFSQIKVQEGREELRELAGLVADLAEQLAKLHPTEESDELADRARALTTKLTS